MKVEISEARLAALEAVAAASNVLKTRGNGIETLVRALDALTAVKARESNPMGLPWTCEGSYTGARRVNGMT